MANETKHTPAPWVAVEIGQGGPADNPMPVCEIRSADGHAVIAEYVDGKNAPLLAAAPLLLDALKELSACYCEARDEMSQADRERHRKVLNKARAAIAAATGSEVTGDGSGEAMPPVSQEERVFPGIQPTPEPVGVELPHAHGTATCNDCGNEWVAVWPLGADALECPNCHGSNTDREQAAAATPTP
jgi:hypothetical protein